MDPLAFIIVAIIAGMVGAGVVYAWLLVDAWLHVTRNGK